ncbi:galactonate dehydratase [Rhodococcus sp. 27YEA15]|uniref:mandelate racemase/muconate lactonizing enzyme family protein n=1 Tax=Rhodococcus sp. 27YEA15 TaxID=3156259 RepID=UPI003C7E0D01
MKIIGYAVFSADAGYRTAKYLRIDTDGGISGWSEYYDQFNVASLEPVISSLIGALQAYEIDPASPMVVSDTLHAATKIVAGGIAHQAVAAIENACYDIQGKYLGVPVHALLGGKSRSRIPLYWTHFGSFRAAFPDFFKEVHGFEPLREMEDLGRLASELQESGVRAVKTNPIRFVDGKSAMYGSGLRIGPGIFDKGLNKELVRDVHRQIDVLQDSLGPDIDIMLDINFTLRGDGYKQFIHEFADRGLRWIELDGPEPDSLRIIRESSKTPIASLESLYGPQQYAPFLEARAVDVPIVDVIWNGVAQSTKIAHLADAYGVDIALHNPVGQLGTVMSAHFAAAHSNVRVLEARLDEAPWGDTFLTDPPCVENGHLVVSDAPGWGTAIDPERLLAYPERTLRS